MKTMRFVRHAVAAGSRYVAAAAMMVMGWWVPTADAQREAYPPDDVSTLPQWACVIIFAGFIVAIAFKNPKRTHQS